MAKVTSPFFGFHARNQIAKSLVYFPWKGINAVRSWVIPANPNTAAQQIVRVNFGQLVATWHSALLYAIDKIAWNVAARIVKYKPQSGFNRFLGIYRTIKTSGATAQTLGNFTIVSSVHNVVQFNWTPTTHVAGDTGTFFWGPHPSSMYNSAGANYLAGPNTWDSGIFDSLQPAGEKMYVKLITKDVGGLKVGETGIYAVTLT